MGSPEGGWFPPTLPSEASEKGGGGEPSGLAGGGLVPTNVAERSEAEPRISLSIVSVFRGRITRSPPSGQGAIPDRR